MAAEQTQKHPTLPEVKEELKKIIDRGFPILAMGLATYLKNMILVMCMGRLGSLELAGGALAIGFTNITGYSVLSGLALGMEPLSSQAFGSRNLTLVSLALQRTIFMLLTASIPIAFLWFNFESLMLKLHQDSQIIHVASVFCRFAVPDLIANSFLHPLRIYLRCKGTTWPLLWCTSLATMLHFPITVYLTFTLCLGIQGIAISTFVSNFVTLFFLLGYIFFTYDQDGSPSKPLAENVKLLPSISVGEQWIMLLQLAIPSCLAVCLEWWWYEFMTVLAGYLDRPEVPLAASAIVIQTTSLMYTLPSALSASVSSRVGNELGAGRPAKARLATGIAIGLAFLTSTFGFILTTIGREAWGRVFTKDREVLELTATVLPIIGLCELANCPQTTCCGVLRGSARPGVGAGINFYSFYLMGTPVAIILAFVWKLGFLGLCYGLLAAQVACVISMLIVTYSTDWEGASLKAKQLVGRTNELPYEDQLVKIEEGNGFLKRFSF
ncbi:protein DETOXIFICATION 55 isoform X1 [Solanum lycopersicum]|uniref:Protein DETOXIFICATION n=1 Tax=Solanum lycopersicum TaxID=4081 RepID=A0A3Q7EG14_SOLLC|nr:protein DETOXIFICATION 55 isoform X1 [Solanum lycopersicum]